MRRQRMQTSGRAEEDGVFRSGVHGVHTPGYAEAMLFPRSMAWLESCSTISSVRDSFSLRSRRILRISQWVNEHLKRALRMRSLRCCAVAKLALPLLDHGSDFFIVRRHIGE